MNTGLLIARLILGVALAAHGAQKLPLAYTAATLVLAFVGFGRYALDHAFGLDRSPPITAGFATFFAVVVALANLLSRHPSPRGSASARRDGPGTPLPC